MAGKGVRQPLSFVHDEKTINHSGDSGTACKATDGIRKNVKGTD